jgi:predicted  nucleic acid-binding Zn-ribbon protein
LTDKADKGKLMQTLKEFREKIQTLETERSRLLREIESLRKAAELRAVTLEGEVTQLREEVKSLREFLGTP